MVTIDKAACQANPVRPRYPLLWSGVLLAYVYGIGLVLAYVGLNMGR